MNLTESVPASLSDEHLRAVADLVSRGLDRQHAAVALAALLSDEAVSAAIWWDHELGEPVAVAGPVAGALRGVSPSPLLERARDGVPVAWSAADARAGDDNPWLLPLIDAGSNSGLIVTAGEAHAPHGLLLLCGPADAGWVDAAAERVELLGTLAGLALCERPGERPAALDDNERDVLASLHHAGSGADICRQAADGIRRLLVADWVLVARSDAFGARFSLAGTEQGPIADEEAPLLSWVSRRLEPTEGPVDPRATDRLSRQLRALGIAEVRTVSADFMGERFGVLQAGYRRPGEISSAVRRRLGRLAFHVALALRQDALRQAQEDAVKRLREAQSQATEGAKFRALAQMAGGVAHEFNNALGGILGRAQMLQRQTAEPEVLKGLGTILEIGFRAAETVKQLQEFTRERSDEDFRPMTCAEVAERLEMTIRRRVDEFGRGSGKRYAVEFDVAPLDGRLLANLDELDTAVVNVITNALEATPGGGVLAVGARTDARHFELTVVDRGVGMSDEVRGSCFDPFFSTKAQTGVGLGLSVTYGIISRHHGEIEIDSQVGAGTTVRLTLPLAADPAALLHERPRVLVIDDEAALCEVLSELFAGAGYEVDSCAGGREGIDLLASRVYDLVCTDLKTADVSGWEVARAAKSQRPGLPVLLLTGFRDQLRPQDVAESGVDLVLGKPFTLQQVLDAAQGLLDGE